MRAAVLYGQEDLRIEVVDPPPLQSGEVRIEIQAALTCGTDLKVYKRGYHARMIVPPAPFGHELAGIISEKGADVTGWHVGDRVVVANSAPCGECFFCQHFQENLCDDLLFLNGAYAESIVVPSRLVTTNLLRLRPETSFRDAALTEPLACVVQGAEDAGLLRGQHVLIIGAGPIGLMFAVLSKYLGCKVTVAGRGAPRLRKAEQLGATTIDINQRDLLGLAHSAELVTPDVVIEAVGKAETWAAAIQLARKGGLVNLFGGCPSGTQVSLDTSRMHYSALKLVSSFHHTPRTIRRALELIEAGCVQAQDFVDGECSLSRLPSLFQQMLRGNSTVKNFVQVNA